MVNESLMDLYDYLYRVFYDVVTKNVYPMGVPKTLTQDDVDNGFIVLRVGNIRDESEFSRQAYGDVRCFVQAYVPPLSRGRLDCDKYAAYEDAINNMIHIASQDNKGVYNIQEDSVLASWTMEVSNGNDNTFFTFVKSFIINIDEEHDMTNGDLFIGLNGETLSTRADVEHLLNLQYYATHSPLGDYTITFPSTQYLWICTTNVVHGVQANGFEVPMEAPIRIDDLLCYRTSNTIIQGEMEFTII